MGLKSLCLVFLLGSTILNAFTASAQKTEWQQVLNLLNREACYFEGKGGKLQKTNEAYKNFVLQEISVSGDLIIQAYRLYQRADGDSTEHTYRETLVLQNKLPVINAFTFDSSYSYHFEGGDSVRFLEISLDDEVIQLVENWYRNMKTEEVDQNQMEQTSGVIRLPIRSENLAELRTALKNYTQASGK